MLDSLLTFVVGAERTGADGAVIHREPALLVIGMTVRRRVSVVERFADSAFARESGGLSGSS